MMASRQPFQTIVISGLLAALLLGSGGYGWYRLNRAFEASLEIALHAPGTYYFAGFRGGALGRFQPTDEIPKEEALARDVYVIGAYDNQGRLIAIEKRFGGEQVFRVEYDYDETGLISNVR
jgi:YD repeat-containing protein